MATIINLDGGHAILIERGFFRNHFYFDSAPMTFCGESTKKYATTYRFAAVINEDSCKVTYALIVTEGFFWWQESIRVEKFEGSSMMQWFDEIGEQVYYSKNGSGNLLAQ